MANGDWRRRPALAAAVNRIDAANGRNHSALGERDMRIVGASIISAAARKPSDVCVGWHRANREAARGAHVRECRVGGRDGESWQRDMSSEGGSLGGSGELFVVSRDNHFLMT